MILLHRCRKPRLQTTCALAAVFCVLTVGCKAQSQLVRDDQQCEQNISKHPDLALPYCTALVNSGKLSQKNHALALILRGVAYRNLGRFDPAVQDFSAAIQIEPAIANAYNHRGVAYDHKREYDMAIHDYDEAIRLQPDYPDAFNNRGLVYKEKGEYSRALQDFDQAIRLRPGYVEAIANRAGTYVYKGEYDRAIEELTRAIKLEPQYAGDYNDRAAAYLGKKDYSRALEDLDRAVKLSPQDPQFLETRGITHFYLHEFRDAEADLSHAFQLAPAEPSVAVWLYLAQVRLGENATGPLKTINARLKPIWPKPAVGLYLGELTRTTLLALAKRTDADKDRKQHCQAYFFAGEDALIHHDQSEARKMFEESAKAGVNDSYEFMGAIAELDHLNNHSPGKK